MWNWSNDWWQRRYRKGIFRVIVACDITWSQSFRVNFVSDLHRTNTKLALNVCIYCSVLFSHWRLEVTVGIWNLCLWFCSFVPLVPHCPTCALICQGLGSKNCATYCAEKVFEFPSGIHGILKFGESPQCHSLVITLFCLCNTVALIMIQCGDTVPSCITMG